MMHSYAAEAIAQQRRDARLHDAERHRVVRPARASRRHAVPETAASVELDTTPVTTADQPARARRLWRRLAWVTR